MSNANYLSSKVLIFVFSLALAAAAGIPALGQDADHAPSQGGGYVDDWSFHHLVFSNPGTREDAVTNGKLDKWQKITSDPRYRLQLQKRSMGTSVVTRDPGFAAEPASVVGPPRMPRFPTGFHQVNNAIDKDWSQTLGSGTTASSSVTTIAATLSSSNVSNSSTLTVDGVTFYASPPAAATATIVVECSGSGCAGTTTDPSLISHTSKLVIGGVTYTFAATGASLSSSAIISNGSTSGPDADLMAENIEAAINDTASQCGSPSGSGCFYTGSGGITAANTYVTATVSANTITLTANTPGTAGNSSPYTFACTQGTNTAFDAPAGTTCSSSATDLTGGSYGTTSGTSSPPTFTYTGSGGYDTGATLATQIATAINANPTVSAVLTAAGTGTTTGTLTLTANHPGTGANVTLSDSSFSAITALGSALTGGTSATVQPNAYPAKFGVNGSPTSASCSDFVVYPTGQPGSTSAANIIAYSNLYSGCGSPATYWAFNTENGLTGYAVTTSPVLSLDGTKVAFIQSNGTNSYLVVVRWAASSGTLTSPIAPNLTNNITNCTVPCMTVTALSHNDTYSAPFYNYSGADDALYVGDDSGNLEKFTGVFNGAAVTAVTPIALSTWPIVSPVYDVNSGCVFVGDTQGYLYKANSGVAGTVCTIATFSSNLKSEILGNGSTNEGIFDAVLLDPVGQRVYAFVTDSAAITATGTCAAGSNCVAEFATSFANGAAPARVEPVGTGGAGYNLYAGSFDNVFYSSATPAGDLYVVGNTATKGGATLYRITIASGSMSNVAAPVTGINSTEYPWPSPVTEFCNNGTSACTANTTATTAGIDYIFFSVNEGTPTGCTNATGNGCILSYVVTNEANAPSPSNSNLNVTTPANNGCWATGGIVVDNSVPTGTKAGASQIYFVNLNGYEAGGDQGATQSSNNCSGGVSANLTAVQASQSAP